MNEQMNKPMYRVDMDTSQKLGRPVVVGQELVQCSGGCQEVQITRKFPEGTILGMKVIANGAPEATIMDCTM